MLIESLNPGLIEKVYATQLPAIGSNREQACEALKKGLIKIQSDFEGLCNGLREKNPQGIMLKTYEQLGQNGSTAVFKGALNSNVSESIVRAFTPEVILLPYKPDTKLHTQEFLDHWKALLTNSKEFQGELNLDRLNLA
jgi:hypothetical protein